MFQNYKFRRSPFQLILAMALVAAVVFSSYSPTLAVAPDNDTWQNATEFLSLPYSVTQDLTEATSSMDDTTDCMPWGTSMSNTVWYKYTPDQTRMIYAWTTPVGFDTVMGVFIDNGMGGLSRVACEKQPDNFPLTAQAGTTYYFRIGASSSWFPIPTGSFTLDVSESPPPAPANDNFAGAIPFSTSDLPFTYSSNNMYATVEGAEEAWCTFGGPDYTVWFSYTATESRSVIVQPTQVPRDSYLGIYTGTALDNLSVVACGGLFSYGPVSFNAEAGKTYYIQLGTNQAWSFGGPYTLSVDFTPPPTADFGYTIYDPSIFDSISFYDSSSEPGGAGFSEFGWDFGDGTKATGPQPSHQYAKDDDYIVTHTVKTPDGRSASNSKVLSVRTHDVTIAKFTVPQSANSGQTRSIVVGISNVRYPDTVTVELQKSTPSGYVSLGTLMQTVPLRSLNRTTEFSFNYTFTKGDAAMGKMTFRAIATIQGYRDALPSDNEAISLPTKIGR